MKVRKDERNWKVVLELSNKFCHYLFYPCDYEGCFYLRKNDIDNDECTLENCPFIKKEE